MIALHLLQEITLNLCSLSNRTQTSSHTTTVHTHTQVAHLLQLPVELGRSESVDLSEISSEQEHQAAVMNVERVMVAVHL